MGLAKTTRTALAAALALAGGALFLCLPMCAAATPGAADAAVCAVPPYEPVSGEAGPQFEPTGFFRAVQADGRDWVVDPLGHAITIAAIDHVRPAGWRDRDLGYDIYARFVETNYPSRAAWLDETLGRLRDWGFNTLANHCDEPLLRHRGLAHTITLYLGGEFGRAGGKDPDRWITPWSGPCTGLPNVFHPEFENEVRKAAARLCAPERDDPWLLGWFLDNELKWWGPDTARKDLTLFDTVRALPKTHSARQALEDFLTQRRRGAEKQRHYADVSLRLCVKKTMRRKYFFPYCLLIEMRLVLANLAESVPICRHIVGTRCFSGEWRRRVPIQTRNRS